MSLLRADGIQDPLQLQEILWPHVSFYAEQIEIIQAMTESAEVIVPAGNMLGKDFVGGFIALSFFTHPWLYFDADYVESIEATREQLGSDPHTVRVLTTSVRDDHLDVLWGEINRYVETCRWPLVKTANSVLRVQHREITKYLPPYAARKQCPLSYLKGVVSKSKEGVAGHHAAYTLIVIDEASGVPQPVYEQCDTWAKRKLIIGNCNPCPVTHFFRKGVKEGDIPVEQL